MRSYWMQTNGGASALELRETPQPQPGPRQLLLRMHAASLNRGEFIAGHGLHKAGQAKAIGMEGAGEVVQAAEGSRFQAGDRVMGRCGGAFAEFALMDEVEAIPVPASLTWDQAASVPLVFLVVHDMLVLQGRLQAGEWVLVNGVSSGVGVASLQLAKALGARVIGTSRSPEKLARLQPLGLDLALPGGADFHQAVMAATDGKGANLVINTVGGSVFAENIRSMAFAGRLATVGYVDGVLEAPLDLLALHAKRLTLFGVSNKLRTAQQRASGLPGLLRDVLPALADGRIKPLVDRVFPFEQLAQAKACMEADQHVGKLVLTMPAA